jgi:hypothetical protein
MRSDECLDGWSGGGWGVFIALNHQNNRWGWLLSMGAPDSPVRQSRDPTFRVRAVSTVGALSSSGTGQSGVAPDRHCSLSGAPLAATLTSARTVALQASIAVDRCTGSRRSAWCNGQSGGTPDSSVNYSGARPQKPEGEEFGVVRSWCTGHSPVAHRTVRCARQGTLNFFAPLLLNPNLDQILVCVEPVCTCRIYNLEQTS